MAAFKELLLVTDPPASDSQVHGACHEIHIHACFLTSSVFHHHPVFICGVHFLIDCPYAQTHAYAGTKSFRHVLFSWCAGMHAYTRAR